MSVFMDTGKRIFKTDCALATDSWIIKPFAADVNTDLIAVSLFTVHNRLASLHWDSLRFAPI